MTEHARHSIDPAARGHLKSFVSRIERQEMEALLDIYFGAVET